MRIIAGDKRGTKLFSPEDESIRPTSDKARGAVFNILEHAGWAGALFAPETTVLDVFCGTGAFGLESLSRGAGQAVFIDSDASALHLAKTNAEKLGYQKRCRFQMSDAARLAAALQPARLVFLDPPYKKGLLAPALENLAANGWLEKGAILVAESRKDEATVAPQGFTARDSRSYGIAQFLFMIYQ
jgi:16S rRNA (guanine966-N2)-methyltransferase